MPEQLNQNLKSEAVRIGEELLEKAESEDSGLSWKTMVMGAEQQLSWAKSESIYAGVGGIVLFFIELYRQTNEQSYYHAAIKGGDWVSYYCSTHDTTSYAFFTGRLGAAYVMLKLAELTGDREYHKKALKIADGCEVFLEQNSTVDDLINGTSGVLLGLMHLYMVTKEQRLLKNIKLYTYHLINTAHIASEGLFWDRTAEIIRGLCGFSHGAAGIGYVFLQLGKFFNNPCFFEIAKLAFQYENNLFNEETGNWPDFRKGIYTKQAFEQHKQAYLEGNRSFFAEPGDMAAWCHGAPGIGLSRLKAFELLEENQYLTDVDRAIHKADQDAVSADEGRISCTVCHGTGGNAMLYLEAYRQLGNEEHLDLARQVGSKILAIRSRSGRYLSGYPHAEKEDLSLFMGNAGIGYFLLQILDPLNTPSVVKPDIVGPFDEALSSLFSFSNRDLNRNIIDKLYPKTFSIYTQVDASKSLEILDLTAPAESRIEKLTEAIDKGITSTNSERLAEAFRYETAKLSLDRAAPGYSYISIKTRLEISKNHQYLEKKPQDIHKLTLLKNEDTLLLSSDWDWTADHPQEQPPEIAEEHYIILIASPEGVIEQRITAFAFEILQKFEQPRTVNEVLQDMVQEFEAEEPQEMKLVQEKSLEQICEGLKFGILLIADS